MLLLPSGSVVGVLCPVVSSPVRVDDTTVVSRGWGVGPVLPASLADAPDSSISENNNQHITNIERKYLKKIYIYSQNLLIVS